MKIYEIQYELAKTENERTGLKYTKKIQADNKIHACKKIFDDNDKAFPFVYIRKIDGAEVDHRQITLQVLNKNYKINIQK